MSLRARAITVMLELVMVGKLLRSPARLKIRLYECTSCSSNRLRWLGRSLTWSNRLKLLLEIKSWLKQLSLLQKRRQSSLDKWASKHRTSASWSHQNITSVCKIRRSECTACMIELSTEMITMKSWDIATNNACVKITKALKNLI